MWKYLPLCDPTDHPVHGILQARTLEWVASSLLQGIFPTQGSHPGLPHRRWILSQLSLQGSPTALWYRAPQKMNLAIKKMHNLCPRETITALLIACKCLWVSKLHDVFLNRCSQGLVYQKMTILSVFASMSRFCAQPTGTVRSLDVENSAWVLPPTPDIYDLSEVFFFFLTSLVVLGIKGIAHKRNFGIV